MAAVAASPQSCGGGFSENRGLIEIEGILGLPSNGPWVRYDF